MKNFVSNAIGPITGIFGFIFLFFILPPLLVPLIFSSNDINSIFSRDELDYQGYVYAFPNSDNDKNYHLKADMHKFGNIYEIIRIYFYNNGYLDISSDNPELTKNGELYCDYFDSKDNEWCFRFYGEMVSSSK